jgi:hypothetical protein
MFAAVTEASLMLEELHEEIRALTKTLTEVGDRL